MDDKTLKLTNVLSDPTRFSIYKYIVDINRAVNVHEIADTFKIHPNVARLHLTKLKDVSLLSSEKEKTGKGGRPSQIYELSDVEICLQFPNKNYKLLANIAIKSLNNLGEEGVKAFGDEGKNQGIDLAKKALINDGIENIEEIPISQRIESIKQIFLSQGLLPILEVLDENTITFQLKNCIFRKTDDKDKDSSICQMHCSLFRGIFETYLGEIDFIKEDSKKNESACCKYYIILLPVI